MVKEMSSLTSSNNNAEKQPVRYMENFCLSRIHQITNQIKQSSVRFNIKLRKLKRKKKIIIQIPQYTRQPHQQSRHILLNPRIISLFHSIEYLHTWFYWWWFDVFHHGFGHSKGTICTLIKPEMWTRTNKLILHEEDKHLWCI